MPRGRSIRNASPLPASKLRRACRSVTTPMIQALEPRQLLTALSGDDRNLPSSMIYVDHENNLIEVRLAGHITAEFISLNVRQGPFGGEPTYIVRDPVEIDQAVGEGFEGLDLYSIYISKSDVTGTISIAKVGTLTSGITGEEPFTGNIDRFNGGTNNEITGSVYIGYRSPGVQAQPTIAVPYRRAFGLRPAAKAIFAGIQSGPGLDIGAINIGGVVSGSVALGGNIDNFYAGAIATGAGNFGIGNSGLQLGGPRFSGLPNNFSVGGSIRHLKVLTNIGLFDGIETGVDFRINGRLGDIQVGGDNYGTIEVLNNADSPVVNSQNEEVEQNDLVSFLDTALVANLGHTYRNDTFETAQILGTEYSKDLKQNNLVDMIGDLNDIHIEGGIPVPDTIDYYALPVMAGQKITFKLSNEDVNSNISWQLFAPDGSAVADSDLAYNPNDKLGTGGDGSGIPVNNHATSQYTFAATQPGGYRLAVAGTGSTYRLIVDGMDNLAMGGINVAGAVTFDDLETGLHIRTGDFGAFENRAGDLVFRNNADGAQSILRVDRGNIRSIVAASIDLGTQMYCYRGSVGLLHALGGDIAGNDDASSLATIWDVDTAIQQTIGGSYQTVKADLGSITANLVARQGIGTLRATLTPADPPQLTGNLMSDVIVVNSDQIGNDGIIDLIDAERFIGWTGKTGPAIWTGPSGNIRYMRGRQDVFADSFFGGLNSSTTQIYQPGQVVSKVDDSGNTVRFTATTVGGIAGSLTVQTYGIRDKGGVVVTGVDTTTGLDVFANGTSSAVDIGEIRTGAAGTALTLNSATQRLGYAVGATGTTATAAQPTNPVSILIHGTVPTSVYDITNTGAAREEYATSTAATNGTINYTSIENLTAGEIPSVFANTIGYLRARRIGTATPMATPAQLQGQLIVGLEGEIFTNVTTAIRADAAIQIAAREDVANVYIVGAGTEGGGSILQELTANSDRTNASGAFDGITGPIQSGWLQSVYIGEGILTRGTSSYSLAGLYGQGGSQARIGPVNGDVGAFIRGRVIAGSYIDSITLRDGSLIEATVENLSEPPPVTIPVVTPLPPPDASTGPITITGKGGIIGSSINLGRGGIINVTGFGIVSSAITMSTVYAPANQIIAGGLGIRNSMLQIGDSLSQVVAGNLTGATLDVNAYDGNTLFSTRRKTDPYSGFGLSTLNDLYKAIGVNAATSAVAGNTTAGVFENSLLIGHSSVNKVQFYEIRSTKPDYNLNSVLFPTRISIANNVDTITTSAGINGAQITTGAVKTYAIGGDIRSAKITSTSSIGSINAKAIRGTTTIRATGPSGSIGSVTTKSTMAPFELTATKSIGTIKAGGALGASASSQFGISAPIITSITVGGDILSGTGISASTSLGTLTVGGDVQAGAKIIVKKLGTKTITGHVFGTIRIG